MSHAPEKPAIGFLIVVSKHDERMPALTLFSIAEHGGKAMWLADAFYDQACVEARSGDSVAQHRVYADTANAFDLIEQHDVPL